MEEKMKVLFFDDEPYISESLARALRLSDRDVTLVSEIERLFVELRSNQFDIIILDVMAPTPESDSEYGLFTKNETEEMEDGLNTGVVTAKKIWKIPNYKDTPILFLSARRDPRPSDPELQTHKCDYLRKPELARTINEKLSELLNLNTKK